MNKLIVFTSLASLYRVDREKRMECAIPLLEKAKTIVFDEELNSFKKAEMLSDGDIFFFNDSLTEQDTLEFVHDYDPKLICILKHQYPENSAFKNFGAVKIGVHERDGMYYPMLLDVMTDGEGEKFRRIDKYMLKNDPVLLAKNQLVARIQNKDVPDSLEGELKKFETALKELKKKSNEDWLSDAYVQAFEKFIDVLYFTN